MYDHEELNQIFKLDGSKGSNGFGESQMVKGTETQIFKEKEMQQYFQGNLGNKQHSLKTFLSEKSAAYLSHE